MTERDRIFAWYTAQLRATPPGTLTMIHTRVHEDDIMRHGVEPDERSWFEVLADNLRPHFGQTVELEKLREAITEKVQSRLQWAVIDAARMREGLPRLNNRSLSQPHLDMAKHALDHNPARLDAFLQLKRLGLIEMRLAGKYKHYRDVFALASAKVWDGLLAAERLGADLANG